MSCRSLLAACFMLASCAVYSSAVKMKVIFSPQTSVKFHRVTRRYMPKNITLQIKYIVVWRRERPLLINGHAYLAVSLLDNGQVDSNSYATEITDLYLGNRSTNRRPARNNGTIKRVEPTTEQLTR
jgi:hypothetical protein